MKWVQTFLCLFFLSNIGFSQSWQYLLQLEFFQGTGAVIKTYQHSLASVQGRPAIAAYDITHKNLGYVRANDANGSSWNPIQFIRTEGDVGEFCILKVVNGNPAICYRNAANTQIEYIRANDATGTSWGTPIVLAAGTNSQSSFSFDVINSVPALVYAVGFNDIHYIKANDANGSSWGTSNMISNLNLRGVQLFEVNGAPAIAFQNDFANLRFVRANDANGSAWGTSTIIHTSLFFVSLGSVAIINGNPAMTFRDNYTDRFNYIRASDANGSAWGTAQLIERDVINGSGSISKLMMIDGLPAIYYGKTSSTVNLTKATDANGDVWDSPTTIINMYSNNNGGGNFTLINGNPASLSFSNDAAYQYITMYRRASNTAGTNWGYSGTTFNATGDVGKSPTLAIINDMPSVVYQSAVRGVSSMIPKLTYNQCADNNGYYWPNPINVSSISDAGLDCRSALASVNGKPAICYSNQSSGLRYTRYNNNWSTPVVLDAGSVLNNSQNMEVAGGTPVVSYWSNGALKFIRANDADGNSWGGSQTLSDNIVQGDISLAIVNGSPAIAYPAYATPTFYTDLRIIRASNTSGTAWNTPITVVGGTTVKRFIKLRLINGKPAIIYYNNPDIYYVIATDANGTTWNAPQRAYTHNTDDFVSELDFCSDGNLPIIVFKIETNTSSTLKELYSVKANSTEGETWSVPQLISPNKRADWIFSMATLRNGRAALVMYSQEEAFPYFTTTNSVPSKPLLAVKAILQGSYNATTQLMNDDLRSKSLIPLTEPYSGIAGFTHVGGGGGETITPSVLSDNAGNSIVDWFFLELRDKNNAASVLATRSALLQRDGDVVDIDGVSPLSFNVAAGDYFVSVRHRNHLGARTSAAKTLSTTSAVVVDFTDFTAPTAIFGVNPQKVLNDKQLLWMGNVKQDGILKYSGLNNDRLPILTRIGGTNISATVNGYFIEDCNMDGIVKYSGLNNDRLPILTNIGGTNITATIIEQF